VRSSRGNQESCDQIGVRPDVAQDGRSPRDISVPAGLVHCPVVSGLQRDLASAGDGFLDHFPLAFSDCIGLAGSHKGAKLVQVEGDPEAAANVMLFESVLLRWSR